MGDNAAEDADMIEVPMAVEVEAALITGMITRSVELATVKHNGTIIIKEGVDKTTHIEVDADSGMEMTQITVTETIGIEIPMVKVTLTGVGDGIIIIEVKDTVIVEEGEDGIPISNITIQGINRNPNIKIRIIIGQHRWDINIDTQSHMANIHTLSNNNNINHKCQLHHNKLQNICQLCHSQGHYDYQCQFAGDFMARTQKALNQGRSYSHQDPNHGEWSQGDNDNNDPNGQPFSIAEDHDAADPPLRILNVFYQGTNVEMLEETYLKFKKNILPKMKKMQPNFQEPVVEYCEPEQVIDICSYNHYPILDKSNLKQEKCNDDNDIYDTSELEHEFEYGIYEDVLKTEPLMAELKRIDEAENENKKLRDVQFGNFPLEQFSDAGKVANEGDPHLKAAADMELYDLEKRTIQIDIEKHEYDNSSENTDDNSSPRADDDITSPKS